MSKRKMAPVHPGEVLQEEFLTPLARCFNTSPEFWLGLQAQYDLDVEEDGLGDRIAREVKVYAEIH